MTFLQTGLAKAAAASGYQISRSLRFNSADSAYLSRTPASAGSRTTWTLNFWFKRSKLGAIQVLFSAGTSGNDMNCYLSATDTIVWFNRISSAMQGYKETSQVFRDTGAPCNFHFVWDSTNATAADRMRMYMNGVRITTFGTTTNPASSELSFWNSNVALNIGSDVGAPSSTNSGYYSDVRFVDGQALEPTSFGAFDANTGVWSPISYAGTYGTNGFYLNFSDNSAATATTLGKDSSGNSNNWTPNNFSVTAGVGNDSLVDTPTNYGTDTGAGGEVRGNYATLNPLNGNTALSLANGNLDVSSTGTACHRYATFGVSSGKWYWEMTLTAASTLTANVGISNNPYSTGSVTTGIRTYYSANGNKYTDATASAYGASYTTNDVVGMALDMDSGNLTFYKNGVSQGVAFTGLTGEWFPMLRTDGASGSIAASFNFGQRPFAYTAPSGFKALCTQNLPTPAIGATSSTLASKNFNIALYTGNNNVSQTISGVGFQPDLIWIKNRDNVENHHFMDSVRGANKFIHSNNTNAERTGSFSNGYNALAFTSDGFSITNATSQADELNFGTRAYATWVWKAGGTAVTNTSGTISSQVSANTSAGISVVTYTGNGTDGATVGHGLGVAPKMAFIKNRGAAQTWMIFTPSTTQSAGNTFSSTTVTLGSKTGGCLHFDSGAFGSYGMSGDNQINANTNTYVMYTFAEVAGFSKFGSYTGNGSTDGPFLYCGFRPKFIMVKRTDAVGDWKMWDAARNTYNVTNKPLWANLTNAEGSGANIDFLSNGVKIRSTDTIENASGGTYIFAAFGESPFNYSRAR